jgi:hypothetical protein
MLDRLKEHWLSGMSSSESCSKLNAEFNRTLTRNAVIGKRHRHFMTDAALLETVGPEADAVKHIKEREDARIEGRKKKDVVKPDSHVAEDPLKHQRSVSAIELRTARGRAANARAQEQFAPAKKASDYITIMELNGTNCHWPIDIDGATMFCGQASRTGKSYCDPHWHTSIDKARSVSVRKKDSGR